MAFSHILLLLLLLLLLYFNININILLFSLKTMFLIFNDSFAFQPSEPPGSPTITSSDDDIQATSLTVRWTAPADDGGRAVTGYRVRVLRGSTVVKNEILDADERKLAIGALQVNTTYTLEVYAKNVAGEGSAGTKTVKTKYEGVRQCSL